MRRVINPLVAGLSLLASTAAETSSSSFQINFPQDLKIEGGYDHSDALFGIPNYGGAVTATLIYADSTACDGLDTTKGYPVPEAGQGWPSPFILMIDRGDCTFVAKVREAQHKGAAAVVIADNTCLCGESCTSSLPCESVRPIMADDGSGGDVTIPALMLRKENADTIKSALKGGSTILATMAWDLPAPDNIVEWDLWTSSTDEDSAKFKKDFYGTIKALGHHQTFTPHYYIIDGTKLGCTTGDVCGNQCTNGGRYCLPDPDADHNLHGGLSGADVVEENLRRMCVWEYANERDPGVGDVWWKYVNAVPATCNTAEKFQDLACKQGVMKSVGVDSAIVAKCMADSGGTTANAKNDRFEAVLADIAVLSIIKLPEVYVNNIHERGTVTVASVLTTICNGYLAGTEPEVCACVELDPSQAAACVGSNDFDGYGRGGGGGFSSGQVFGLLCVVIVGMGGIGYVYYKRTQAQMRDQVRGILAEYMPLEEINDSLNPGTQL